MFSDYVVTYGSGLFKKARKEINTEYSLSNDGKDIVQTARVKQVICIGDINSTSAIGVGGKLPVKL